MTFQKTLVQQVEATKPCCGDTMDICSFHSMYPNLVKHEIYIVHSKVDKMDIGYTMKCCSNLDACEFHKIHPTFTKPINGEYHLFSKSCKNIQCECGGTKPKT